MKIKSNPLLFGLYVSLILTVYRYFCVFTNLDLGSINSILYFFVFGISIIIYQKKNETSSFIKTVMTAGIFQIIGTILLYELSKLIIIQPELTEPYWISRTIVSATIIVLGLIANFLFLSIYFWIKKKSFSKQVDDSELLDN